MSEEYCRVPAVHRHHTKEAVLVTCHDDDVWVPRSVLAWQCDKIIDGLKRGDDFELLVMEWFYDKNF